MTIKIGKIERGEFRGGRDDQARAPNQHLANLVWNLKGEDLVEGRVEVLFLDSRPLLRASHHQHDIRVRRPALRWDCDHGHRNG